MSAQLTASAPFESKASGRVSDYLAIARLDHSTKHIFIVPGIALAWLLRGPSSSTILLPILLGFIAAVCIASANYVINEWLDRDFDQHHPTKSGRASVQRELRGKFILLEWLAFVSVGLGAAAAASETMLAIASVFALQGVVYNVQPLRTKDVAFLDVISESVNNPLRLMIGWAMIDATTLPPSSIIFAYWLGGAFLMSAKRFSEYRQIIASSGKDLLVRYRKSFGQYTESSLVVSCLIYSLLSSFFLAIFLIKYRIEYIIAMPPIAILFGKYLAISMQNDSSAQRPEKLYQEEGLIYLAIIIGLLCVIATAEDIPLLRSFTSQTFISIR